MVSPTKASSSRQSKSSKRAAHPQRNTSNGKSSSLSAEYILDSESSEPRDEALSRPNGTKSDQSKEPFPISQQRASSSTLDVLKTQSKAQFRANKERVSLSSKTSSEPDEISSGKSSRSEEISGSDTGTSSEDGLRESGGASRKLRKEVSAATGRPPTPPELTTPYVPPIGFEHTSTSQPRTASDSHPLASSYLKNKQLWHINLPANVPAHLVKEASMQSILKGDPILTYKEAEYGFAPLTGNRQVEKYLILPELGSNGYKTSSVQITETLQLQRLVHLPNVQKGSHVFPDGASENSIPPKAFKKTVRLQPKGLKMRYRPFGDTSMSESKGTNDIGKCGFRQPHMTDSQQQSEKQLLNGTNGVDGSVRQSPAKQPRKKRTNNDDMDWDRAVEDRTSFVKDSSSKADRRERKRKHQHVNDTTKGSTYEKSHKNENSDDIETAKLELKQRKRKRHHSLKDGGL